MKRFADHFSGRAAAYAAYRPSYPPAFIQYLSALCPSHDLAWDAGTGNGQAATLLAEHFARVVATDASPQQLGHARPHPRVTYTVAMADASGLLASSVDLVTVAQALHWFDLFPFYREVRRISKPHGVIAVWCYDLMEVDGAVNPVVNDFCSHRVEPFWPLERRHVAAGYRDLEFPFEEVTTRDWAMTARLTKTEFLGCIGTWSAVANARDREGADLIAELAEALRTVWPDEERRVVTWPLACRVGRMSSLDAAPPTAPNEVSMR